jgi:predicted Na+-dependent transporter
MSPPIPLQWVGFIALPTLFTVMFAIGLMLGPAQVAAAMTRRTILLAVLFAAVVPLPVVTIVAVELYPKPQTPNPKPQTPNPKPQTPIYTPLVN